MNCYNHYYSTAVATCSCGKGLCPDCAHKYTLPICDTCFKSRFEEARKNEITYYVKCYVVSFILFLWIYIANGSIFSALGIACAPWGWSVLNRITPNIFLYMSWMGWLIYFIIKLVLSSLIGIFIAPFQVYKSIKVFTSKY